MGQQQLLLITLSLIVVGAAIAPISYMFRSQASQSNREAMIGDLINTAARAQKFHRTPTTLGGGGNSFNGFYLSPLDTANANGSYSLSTTLPSGAAFVAGSSTPISSDVDTIYIVGCGTEAGTDGTNLVKCFISVSMNDYNVTILN